MTILFSTGYEASSLEDFLGTLKVSGISNLIDVRQIAASRRKGFSKNALRTALESVEIDYVHLAGLGDPKEGRDAARAGRFDDFLDIFSAHMDTPEFSADLDKAIQLTRTGNASLLYYERNPKICHRTLISDKISTLISSENRHLGVREGIAKNGGKGRSRTRISARESVATCG